MQHGVLTRGTLRKWDLVLLIVLGLCLAGAGGGAIIARQAGAGIFFGAIGLLLVIGTSLGWWGRGTKRQWTWDTGSGLIVLDRRGEREIIDEDVCDFSLEYQNHFAAGILKSFTRIFTIQMINQDEMIEKIAMSTTLQLNEKDGLAEAIERIAKRLSTRAEEGLRQGRRIGGEYWDWMQGELTIEEKKIKKTCQLQEVTAVDVVEGQVCIWRTGQDEVYARVPEGSTNALILKKLLFAEMDKRPKKATPPPLEGLGRIIFERNRKKYYTLSLVLAILAGLIGLGILVIVPFVPRDQWVPLLVSLGFLVVAGLLGLNAASCRRSTFRCHEFGVFQSGLSSERTLRYPDVAAFTYSAIRVFVNGAYSGTNLNLNFEPEEGGQAIKYNTSVQNVDPALEDLRDHVSRVVAGKLANRLAAGHTFEWVPQVKFHPQGLVYKPAGWFGTKPEQFINYAEISGHDMKEGFFYLWANNEKNALVKVPVSSRNFFPGLLLLLDKISQTQAGSKIQEPA